MPLHTLGSPVPHGVPAVTDRTGAQRDTPVEHVVRPSTHSPVDGVHGWSATQPMQPPARHTLSIPQEVPSGRLSVPAMHVGRPELQSNVPALHGASAAEQKPPLLHIWQAPPMQTLVSMHGVPSIWLPARTHADCPRPEQSITKIPHGSGTAGKQTIPLAQLEPPSGGAASSSRGPNPPSLPASSPLSPLGVEAFSLPSIVLQAEVPASTTAHSAFDEGENRNKSSSPS
jgi:hypothetical protein